MISVTADFFHFPLFSCLIRASVSLGSICGRVVAKCSLVLSREHDDVFIAIKSMSLFTVGFLLMAFNFGI